MSQPIAYFNGQIVPSSSVAVSLLDAGFVLGTTVAEQLRTFRGRIFRLHDHIARLETSLQIVGNSIPESEDRLSEICLELVAHNHALLDPEDDLGLAILVTPGEYGGYGVSGEIRPTVILHTYPLPFHLWCDKYETGQALAIPPTRQVPGACWPSALKCRSRMHYYLADREAQAMHPGARALLLDTNGHITEASTANVVLFHEEKGLVSPAHGDVLPGISLAQTVELAEQMGLSSNECDLVPSDLHAAHEVFLTSTPLCLLPVVALDGQAIGTGRPSIVFRRLIRAWSELANLDIIGQARRFAARPCTPSQTNQ